MPTVAVLTALPLEYTAVRAHLTHIEKRVHPDYGTRAEVGRLPGTPWQVALLELGEGTRGAAALTERAMTWLTPQAVLFVGVAGGLKDDIHIGDVVIATKVYAIHGGKETPDGFLDRTESWQPPHELDQAARHALRGQPHIHFKPIAAGDVLLSDADSPLAHRLRQRFNDAVAIEMEGSGVAQAAHLAGGAGALIIRGVSDKADADKSRADARGSQPEAAARAAEVAMAVLRELEPKEEEERTPEPPPHHGPVPTASTTLPPRPLGFTGRLADLGHLLTHLEPTADAPTAPPLLISAVTGMGGIGKTALAIEAAHQALSKGWFPGGTLFVDLRGYDDNPVTADQAVLALLDALGLHGPDLPITTARQYDAYQAQLARHRPRTLGGDPTAVLDSGSRGTDQYGRSLVLRPVLETSYRRLPPEQARVLRLLALAPGADVSTEAAAALTDLDEDAAVGLLEDLAAAGLVTARELRWRLHDLVRAFGAGLVAGDAELHEEGERARERLLEFYWRWANAADDRLLWVPGAPEPERFTDRRTALAWLDRERAGLVAAMQWAGEERHAQQLVGLAARLGVYLRWQRHFDDAIAVALAARDAAHKGGDRGAEAGAWGFLGSALEDAGRVEEAVRALTRSRDLYQAARNPHGEATAWGFLGIALHVAGQMEQSIDAHTRARDLYRGVGDRRGEADTWSNLGNALWKEDRTEEAIDAHRYALDLYQAVGDRHCEGMAWNNLGLALHEADRVVEAIEAFGRDLEICREFEDWYGAGQTLNNLARVYRDTHPTQARTHYLQAADAFTRANAPTEAADARARADSLPDA
ncbi:tetratricopeptide repeat protein [Streptomyces sp. CC219B]|uniref:phosphorylase family protein n=1 Tax=Streptomyces sp. CC219B TaxID=3044574 RepID=UPI0024A8C630|nr:tetratricopeptide repeat protein [Streptomyces sp. CC219B]